MSWAHVNQHKQGIPANLGKEYPKMIWDISRDGNKPLRALDSVKDVATSTLHAQRSGIESIGSIVARLDTEVRMIKEIMSRMEREESRKEFEDRVDGLGRSLFGLFNLVNTWQDHVSLRQLNSKV
jgi:hypothetical protein